MDFVAIDFEIANAKWASACQVSLVRVEKGLVKETWVSYICPEQEHQSLGNIQYGKHKIPQDVYLSAPNLSELWPSIQSFIGDLPLVAHNAQFDVGVLNQSLESWDLPRSNFETICSQKLAMALIPEPPHTLKALTSRFSIPLENHHDAKSDALACALLTIALAEFASLESVDQMKKFATYKSGTGNQRSTTASPLPQISNATARHEEILSYLEAPHNLFEIIEQPFLDMEIAVVRTIFGLNLETSIDWITALGGNYVDYYSVTDCDLIIIGNTPKSNTQEKLADITAITKILKEDRSRMSAEEFFDLVFSSTHSN